MNIFIKYITIRYFNTLHLNLHFAKTVNCEFTKKFWLFIKCILDLNKKN